VSTEHLLIAKQDIFSESINTNFTSRDGRKTKIYDVATVYSLIGDYFYGNFLGPVSRRQDQVDVSREYTSIPG